LCRRQTEALTTLAALAGATPPAAAPPVCPWCVQMRAQLRHPRAHASRCRCKVAVLAAACVALPTGAAPPRFFDASAIAPVAVAAAAAAAAAAPPAGAAWRAAQLADSGLLRSVAALRSLEWPHVQSAARRALRAVLAALRLATGVSARATEAALLALRAAVLALRLGSRSLTALVETRRVCRALETVSDAMLAHTADAGVQAAGCAALCATGVWAARRPQRALAAALAAHSGDAPTAALLCAAAARYTRSRLSAHPEARALAEHVAAALAAHARDADVAPPALEALRNTLLHMGAAERAAVAGARRGALRPALQQARAAAVARGDATACATADCCSGLLADAAQHVQRAAAAATATNADDGANAVTSLPREGVAARVAARRRGRACGGAAEDGSEAHASGGAVAPSAKRRRGGCSAA
jgi:hypothetical protein